MWERVPIRDGPAFFMEPTEGGSRANLSLAFGGLQARSPPTPRVNAPYLDDPFGGAEADS